jgi:hypothetical protein
MSFETRCKIGMEWDNEVSSHLNSAGYEIGRYNIENIAPHFTTATGYANANNPSIRFVRYFPDGIASDFKNDVAFFWDAKIGRSIEKDAYETYCEFGKTGREFYLFIKSGAILYCVPIDNVKFLDSLQFVSGYSFKLPVDSDGWIAPRLLSESTYKRWKYKSPNASGTPYRMFDFNKMREWGFSWPFNYQNVTRIIEQNRWKINPETTQQQIIQGVSA